MKKTCKIAATMLAVALAITICCSLVACSKPDLKKNSFKNVKLIEERFTWFVSYSQYVSGEQIANSNMLVAQADRDAFNEYNSSIKASHRYYDVYRGTLDVYETNEKYSDRFGDNLRHKELIVVVPLADPNNVLTLGWTEDPIKEYPLDEWLPLFRITEVFAAIIKVLGPQEFLGTPVFWNESRLDAEGKECGGIIETLEPDPERENFWMQVFTIEHEGQTCRLTESEVLELNYPYMPPQLGE